jgi:hydroxymethylglutaryl-CoA reductase
MKVGDLVISIRFPTMGVGVVVNIDTIEKGGYALAIFGVHGEQPVYPTDSWTKVISESR